MTEATEAKERVLTRERPKVRYTANGVAYVEPRDLFKLEAFWREIERTARVLRCAPTEKGADDAT